MTPAEREVAAENGWAPTDTLVIGHGLHDMEVPGPQCSVKTPNGLALHIAASLQGTTMIRSHFVAKPPKLAIEVRTPQLGPVVQAHTILSTAAAGRGLPPGRKSVEQLQGADAPTLHAAAGVLPRASQRFPLSAHTYTSRAFDATKHEVRNGFFYRPIDADLAADYSGSRSGVFPIALSTLALQRAETALDAAKTEHSSPDQLKNDIMLSLIRMFYSQGSSTAREALVATFPARLLYIPCAGHARAEADEYWFATKVALHPAPAAPALPTQAGVPLVPRFRSMPGVPELFGPTTKHARGLETSLDADSIARGLRKQREEARPSAMPPAPEGLLKSLAKAAMLSREVDSAATSLQRAGEGHSTRVAEDAPSDPEQSTSGATGAQAAEQGQPGYIARVVRIKQDAAPAPLERGEVVSPAEQAAVSRLQNQRRLNFMQQACDEAGRALPSLPYTLELVSGGNAFGLLLEQVRSELIAKGVRPAALTRQAARVPAVSLQPAAQHKVNKLGVRVEKGAVVFLGDKHVSPEHALTPKGAAGAAAEQAAPQRGDVSLPLEACVPWGESLGVTVPAPKQRREPDFCFWNQPKPRPSTVMRKGALHFRGTHGVSMGFGPHVQPLLRTRPGASGPAAIVPSLHASHAPSPRMFSVAYSIGSTVFVHGGWGPSARNVVSEAEMDTAAATVGAQAVVACTPLPRARRLQALHMKGVPLPKDGHEEARMAFWGSHFVLREAATATFNELFAFNTGRNTWIPRAGIEPASGVTPDSSVPHPGAERRGVLRLATDSPDDSKPNTLPFLPALHGHTATVLPGRRVILIGGMCGPTALHAPNEWRVYGKKHFRPMPHREVDHEALLHVWRRTGLGDRRKYKHQSVDGADDSSESSDDLAAARAAELFDSSDDDERREQARVTPSEAKCVAMERAAALQQAQALTGNPNVQIERTRLRKWQSALERFQLAHAPGAAAEAHGVALVGQGQAAATGPVSFRGLSPAAELPVPLLTVGDEMGLYQVRRRGYQHVLAQLFGFRKGSSRTSAPSLLIYEVDHATHGVLTPEVSVHTTVGPLLRRCECRDAQLQKLARRVSDMAAANKGVVPSWEAAAACIQSRARPEDFFFSRVRDGEADRDVILTPAEKLISPAYSAWSPERESEVETRCGMSIKRPLLPEYVSDSSSVEPMAVALTGHSAVAVGSGGDDGVLVMGNIDSPQNGGLALLSIGRQHAEPFWGWPVTQGTPPAQRQGHSATLVHGRYVVVVGGYITAQGGTRHTGCDTWLLDIGQKQPTWWRLPLAPCSTKQPSPRAFHSAGRVGGGQVCIMGGEVSSSHVAGDVWSLEVVKRAPDNLKSHVAEAEERVRAVQSASAARTAESDAAELARKAYDAAWAPALSQVRTLTGETQQSNEAQRGLVGREAQLSLSGIGCPVYGVWRQQAVTILPPQPPRSGQWVAEQGTEGKPPVLMYKKLATETKPSQAGEQLAGRSSGASAVVGGRILVFGGFRFGDVAAQQVIAQDTAQPKGRQLAKHQPRRRWGSRFSQSAHTQQLPPLAMGEVLSISLGPTHIPVPGPSLVRDASALWEAAGSGEVDAGNTPADFALRSVEQGAAAPLPSIVQVRAGGSAPHSAVCDALAVLGDVDVEEGSFVPGDATSLVPPSWAAALQASGDALGHTCDTSSIGAVYAHACILGGVSWLWRRRLEGAWRAICSDGAVEGLAPGGPGCSWVWEAASGVLTFQEPGVSASALSATLQWLYTGQAQFDPVQVEEVCLLVRRWGLSGAGVPRVRRPGHAAVVCAPGALGDVLLAMQHTHGSASVEVRQEEVRAGVRPATIDIAMGRSGSRGRLSHVRSVLSAVLVYGVGADVRLRVPVSAELGEQLTGALAQHGTAVASDGVVYGPGSVGGGEDGVLTLTRWAPGCEGGLDMPPPELGMARSLSTGSVVVDVPPVAATGHAWLPAHQCILARRSFFMRHAVASGLISAPVEPSAAASSGGVFSGEAALPSTGVGLPDTDLSTHAAAHMVEFLYTDRMGRLALSQAAAAGLHAELVSARGMTHAVVSGADPAEALAQGTLPPPAEAPFSAGAVREEDAVEDAPALAQLGSMHMQPRLLAHALRSMVAGYDLSDAESAVGMLQFALGLGQAGEPLRAVCEFHLRQTVPREDLKSAVEALLSMHTAPDGHEGGETASTLQFLQGVLEARGVHV